MSRLAKKPIKVPEKVQLKIAGQKVIAKGKLGSSSVTLPDRLEIKQKDNHLIINSPQNSRVDRELSGTYHSLITNLLLGVDQGHQKILIFKGVGYKAEAQDNKLKLSVGFSHPVELEAPQGEIRFSVEKNKIIIGGFDKQQVGEIAAQVRKIKVTDPYKQKGIKYQDERVIAKEGKAVEKLEEGT
jgi:large subunit ribosomal protein L6